MIRYRNCAIVECDNCYELFETSDGLIYHFDAESDIPEQLPERDWTSDGEHHWVRSLPAPTTRVRGEPRRPGGLRPLPTTDHRGGAVSVIPVRVDPKIKTHIVRSGVTIADDHPLADRLCPVCDEWLIADSVSLVYVGRFPSSPQSWTAAAVAVHGACTDSAPGEAP